MIRMIARLLKVLNSESEPGQVSLAFCFAMIMGFTPLYSLHNIIVILLVLLIRVNLSGFLLGWAVFSGLAYLLDPLFHRIGLALLTASSLEGLWTALYNMTIFRLENFNNTIVMGSLFLSLVLFIPLYIVLNLGIRKYREHIMAWVQKTRFMQAFKASKLYRSYQTLSGWRG